MNIDTLSNMVNVINHLSALTNNPNIIPNKEVNSVSSVVYNMNKSFVSGCLKLDLNNLEGGEKTVDNSILPTLANIQGQVDELSAVLTTAGEDEKDLTPENPFNEVIASLKKNPTLASAIESALQNLSPVQSKLIVGDASKEDRKNRLEKETQKLEEADSDFAEGLKKAKAEVQDRVKKTKITKK
jgi:hypothetical protein